MYSQVEVDLEDLAKTLNQYVALGWDVVQLFQFERDTPIASIGKVQRVTVLLKKKS